MPWVEVTTTIDDQRRWLEGVVAARTSISDIDGQQGKLYYAGYDIADLAAHATFEETVYLLHHRELPTRQQLEDTAAALRGSSALDDFLVGLIPSIAGRTSGETRWTSAPAAISCGTRRLATFPPPTTRTRRPASRRPEGYVGCPSTPQSSPLPQPTISKIPARFFAPIAIYP